MTPCGASSHDAAQDTPRPRLDADVIGDPARTVGGLLAEAGLEDRILCAGDGRPAGDGLGRDVEADPVVLDGDAGAARGRGAVDKEVSHGVSCVCAGASLTRQLGVSSGVVSSAVALGAGGVLVDGDTETAPPLAEIAGALGACDLAQVCVEVAQALAAAACVVVVVVEVIQLGHGVSCGVGARGPPVVVGSGGDGADAVPRLHELRGGVGVATGAAHRPPDLGVKPRRAPPQPGQEFAQLRAVALAEAHPLGECGLSGADVDAWGVTPAAGVAGVILTLADAGPRRVKADAIGALA
jgi:hypothetical protein